MMLKILLVALLSAVASIINIPVGESGFRVSAGIVVMVVLIIVWKMPRIMLTSLISGIAVCLMRVLIDSFSVPMTLTLAGNYLLEVFFYLGYGLIYLLTVVRNRSIYKTPLVVSLVLSDVGGNAIEYFLRFIAAEEVWQNTSLNAILLAAVARSVVIILLVWLYEITLGKTDLKEETAG
jgi:two-component system sensor histidine kinase YcbA